MSTLLCRGYCCFSSVLINAHIVPRGFARDTMDGYPHNLKISATSVHPTQHGVYDPAILCSTCDGLLGKLDDYALDVCRRFPREHVDLGDGTFEMPNVDGNRFANFVLAVLWRASITSRPEFRKVSLGAYEAEVCEVVFGAKPLTAMASYELLVGRYKQTGQFNPERNYTAPARWRIAGLNGWGFALHGFRIMAKIDRRSLPSDIRPAIVNENTKLIGAFVSYETTSEGRAVLEMARAHRSRNPQKAP
jgi:hypothetical protein